MRKILSVLLIMTLLFSSAFAESATATLQELYAQAELLMVQGDYTGAAAKFETLGAYSDASQMSMYCKAIAAAESFGMYAVAVDAFSDLGDFKDSKQLAIYYSARSYESDGRFIVNVENIASVSDVDLARAWNLLDSASIIYVDLALFKDCMSRLDSCRVTQKMINAEQELRSAATQENTYQNALLLQEQGKYEDAKSLFVQLGSYKDCVDRIAQCENAIFEEHEKMLKSYYQQGETLLSEGKWEEAIAAFVKADTYSNAKERILVTYYEQGKALCASGNEFEALVAFYRAQNYSDSVAQRRQLLSQRSGRIAAGNDFTIGLKDDGTVLATGYNFNKQCDVASWENIVAVAAGYRHTVGLRADGTVAVAGAPIGYGYSFSMAANDIIPIGDSDVYKWKDIVAIAAGNDFTLGLKSDGTVVAAGNNKYVQFDVSSWHDIVSIAAGGRHAVGLKSDGTVVVIGEDYAINNIKNNQSDWRDIMEVAAGESHIVGLRADGTVVAAGGLQPYVYGECNVQSWENIVAISCFGSTTVGLHADGTGILAGRDWDGLSKVNNWNKIISIAAGYSHVIGVCEDGTVVAVGDNGEKQCNVSNWVLWD